MNLCLVGEGTRVGMEPITSKQRLYLLYILEAAVRRLGVLGWGAGRCLKMDLQDCQ